MTLPPLPEPDTHCFDDDTGLDVWSHSPDQMRAYGEAALRLADELQRFDGAERESLRDEAAALLRELLADGCNSPAQTLAAIARHREALRDLANAADAVGVRYFDSDDPSDEVQAMQAATINAREVLRAREIVGAEVLPSAERGFTVSQLAEACISAEIPDSQFESLLLALRA